MRRTVITLCTVLALSSITLWVALAGNPHFISASAACTTTDTSDAALQVFFKEAGIGAGNSVAITASATATATYQCINNGGGQPGPKTTTSSPVSESGNFTATAGGNVVNSLTIDPGAGPAAAGFCSASGNNWTVTRVGSVTYTTVAVTDSTNGVSKNVNGTFTCP